MNLTPRELEKLTIFTAGELARKRRARGLKLNHPEAVALITSELLEAIRDGRSVTDVMAFDYTGDDDHLGEEDQSSPEAEVYVSVDRARAVAAERGESVRDELLLYIVHGSLHLCGLDDHAVEDREEMRAAERSVLSSLS